MSTPTAAVDDRVIWRPDMNAEFGVGTEAIRRWIKSGKLPPPDIAISRKTMGWRLSSLRAAGLGLL